MSKRSPAGQRSAARPRVTDDLETATGCAEVAEPSFRSFFEQAAVGMAEMETATGRFLRINRCFCDLVGYTAEEMLDTTFQAITHGDDLQEDLDNMERLKAGTIRKFSMEKRYRRRDASLVWVNLTVSPLWAPGDAPSTHIAIVQDITDRKQTEAALRESERQHRLLVQHLHAGVVVHAPDTRILLANERASALLGLTVDQMLGKAALDPAWRFVREDETPMPLDEYPVERVLTGRQPVRNMIVGICRPVTNDRVWVVVNAFPELGAGGDLRQVVVTFVDVTEQREARVNLQRQADELRARNEELARFNRVAVDRESRMIELKQQVNELSRQLHRAPPYRLAFLGGECDGEGGGPAGLATAGSGDDEG